MIALALLGSCSSQLLQRQPASPLALRYRSLKAGKAPSADVTTSVYRGLLAKSMYSRCRMVPHDSQFFDLLVKRCGGVQALFRSAARLLLERSASTDFLVPLRVNNQLKWIDRVQDARCE